jgi:25S rRNA (uracil2634-N3)-methyltransferase
MMGATILHGIDAKTMKLHADLKMRRFDRIIFNFPHAWFRGTEDHMDATKYVHSLVSCSLDFKIFLESRLSHKTSQLVSLD